MCFPFYTHNVGNYRSVSSNPSLVRDRWYFKPINHTSILVEVMSTPTECYLGLQFIPPIYIYIYIYVFLRPPNIYIYIFIQLQLYNYQTMVNGGPTICRPHNLQAPTEPRGKALDCRRARVSKLWPSDSRPRRFDDCVKINVFVCICMYM